MRLIDEGKIGGSYRKNIKQKVMKGLPKIRCGVLLEDSTNTPATCTYTGDLKTIPAALWKTRLGANTRYCQKSGFTLSFSLPFISL